MLNFTAGEIVSRAAELLWIIARCDVENLSAQRITALNLLRDLEAAAATANIPDLYRAVLQL